MPAPQVTPVQRLKGVEFGWYFALKADYKEAPIKDAATKLLLDDARATMAGRGVQKVVLIRGFDGYRRPIVGWLQGTKRDHAGLDIFSEQTINTGGKNVDTREDVSGP